MRRGSLTLPLNKKLADTEAFAEKKAAKADLEASLQKEGEDIEMEVAKARAKTKNTHNLHLKCDGMIEKFVLRAEMRVGEIDVLNGEG